MEKPNLSNNTFKVINEFIKDIYGYDFIQKPMDERISRINDLKEAYVAIMEIINNQNFFTNKFIKIYPIIEPAVQWNQLKQKGKITENFLNKSKPRLNEHGNFYGTLFELDMASRFLLSNCMVNLDIENYKKRGRQIDFIVCDQTQKETMGIECTSKRFTKHLTKEKLDTTISEKSIKFEEETINKLNLNLDKKILIIDLTRENYQKPNIIPELDKIRLNSKLDDIIFTWREDISREKNQICLKVNYKDLINKEHKCIYFSYLTELRHEKGKIFYYMKVNTKDNPKIGPLGKWKSNK